MGRNEISIFKKWGWEIGKNEQFSQLCNNPMIAIVCHVWRRFGWWNETSWICCQTGFFLFCNRLTRGLKQKLSLHSEN